MPRRECRVVAHVLGQHVASFGDFFHQHPAGVRRRARLERKVPNLAVAFIDEVGDARSRC